MENEFEALPRELKDALARMLDNASSEDGRRAAYSTIRREYEIWPLVQRVIEEARNGANETPSFDLLWTAIRGEVRATIRSVLYRKDDNSVEEVEQQTAIEVFRKRSDYSIEKGTFLVWVRGIARNLARWRRTPNVSNTEIDPPAVRPDQDRLLPPSACFNELLSWVQEKEAHHAVVFLLHEYLEWSLENIAGQLGEKTICDLASLAVSQIGEEVKGLKNATSLFARLRVKAKALGETTLMDLYGRESARAALSHWSGGVKRWMGQQVIGSARRLLTGVCDLRAGSHERLTFLWSRFLRRELDRLCALADRTLLEILCLIRDDFPATDLTKAEVMECTEPLKEDIEPSAVRPAKKENEPIQTLAQCSRGKLAEDLVVWRERIQNMVVAQCKVWNVVAYAYLCGALPGVVGSAKGGVA